MLKYIVVLTAASSKKEALNISNHLLKKRLCACVNILDKASSSFWWKGKIDKAREVILIIKTKTVLFKKIEKEIKRVHSYEVPEIIAVPIVTGSKKYLNWISESVKCKTQNAKQKLKT